MRTQSRLSQVLDKNAGKKNSPSSVTSPESWAGWRSNAKVTGNEWYGQTQFRHHGIRQVLGQIYPPSEPEKLVLRRQKAFIVQGGA